MTPLPRTAPPWIGKLLALCGLLLGATPCAGLRADTLTGVVTEVPNGREILVKAPQGTPIRVVIAGIRTPEPAPGNPGIARRRLHTLLAGRLVSVESTTPHRGGVILGRVLYGGVDIALRLLQSGLAEVVPASPHLAPDLLTQYRQAEASARLHGMGYWQSRR